MFAMNSMAQEKIEWMSWTEAINKNAVEEKVIFVDVYTNWCGWCKKMDASTFKDPRIVDYMNEHYYAVKFNAETRDTIPFNGQNFVNENTGKRGPHQLGVALLDGRMSYPSYAFIGKPWDKTVVPGYMGVKDFSCVLKYFVEGAPVGKTYDEFKSNGCAVASAD
ncbi:MAG: hypothetical protein Salg2KO_14080 [Salibacteraceae bacterium]